MRHIYGSCRSDATSLFSTTVSQCLDSIASWMHSNRLQLNTDQTEVMWCASKHKLPQLSSHPLSVTGALVCSVNTVQDLGVFIDNDLEAATHVRRTVSRCFASSVTFVDTSPMTASVLWWCRLCTQDSTAATSSWLDFLFIYSGASSLFSTLRLVWCLRRYDRVMEALATLHWLRLPQRVYFKVVVMAFRVLHDLAPPYLNQLARVADLPSRCRLRSSSSHQLLVPPFRLTTVGRRTFPVAASLLWNSLPSNIQASSSLSAFRQCLKTFLFRQSFPDIIL